MQVPPLGSYSTHRNFPAKSLLKYQMEIDLEIAATLMTKGLTTFIYYIKLILLNLVKLFYFMQQLVVLVKYLVNGQKV